MKGAAPTYVVTGANSGLGFEIARQLCAQGAHVVLAVRDLARGADAAARMAGAGSSSVVQLDLSDLDEVARCADALLDSYDQLTGLVCNAGIMGGPQLFTAQGFERQMGTNHLGHAALVDALWPLIEASGTRVVMVSSGEARSGALSAGTTRGQLFNPDPYDGRQSYRNSKQANLLFAQHLHRRCRATGSAVSVIAAHPGAVATNLLARQLERAGRKRLASVSTAATSLVLRPAAAGAQSALLALVSNTPSGAFIAPSGLAQLRGPPQVTAIYPSCDSTATAARVWDLTQEALGIDHPPICTHTSTRKG